MNTVPTFSTSSLAEPDLLRFSRLFQELQDLKRQQPAHYAHSIATQLFLDAWQLLWDNTAPEEVAYHITARAVTAILFPGVDEAFFTAARLPREAAESILRDALDRSTDGLLTPEVAERLHGEVRHLAAGFYRPTPTREYTLSPALHLLTRQPRAGATRPDVPRLLLVPPEMHSDHCLLTAVYATLCSEHYGAEPGAAFLCGLAHHLHNAYLPDCGFAGEICLGDHLLPVINNCRREALRELPDALRLQVRDALRYHETIDAPEGRAISAGDVLDRVLDVKWRTRAAAVTDRDILGDLDLVHDGPLKSFQMSLLNDLRLWSDNS